MNKKLFVAPFVLVGVLALSSCAVEVTKEKFIEAVTKIENADLSEYKNVEAKGFVDYNGEREEINETVPVTPTLLKSYRLTAETVELAAAPDFDDLPEVFDSMLNISVKFYLDGDAFKITQSASIDYSTAVMGIDMTMKVSADGYTLANSDGLVTKTYAKANVSMKIGDETKTENTIQDLTITWLK